jgi:hypothetical protein
LVVAVQVVVETAAVVAVLVQQLYLRRMFQPQQPSPSVLVVWLLRTERLDQTAKVRRSVA